MDRERYYNADLYEDSKQLQPIEDFIYSTSESPEGIDHTSIDVRTFNNLKRHALMNKSLISPKFANGSKINKANGGLKTPYKSLLGYTQDRGGGTQYVHRIYPENDSIYVDVLYNTEAFGPGNKYIYNPNNIEFNYDEYDYSKTVPAQTYDYNYDTKEWVPKGFLLFFDSSGNLDSNVTPSFVITELRNLDLPFITPKIKEDGKPRRHRGFQVFKSE